MKGNLILLIFYYEFYFLSISLSSPLSHILYLHKILKLFFFYNSLVYFLF